ncbi:MAG: NAD-dependent alcohol dehydrogenase [Deltaproteobacteria bacterium HGW-Deltaproteobacteria-13]|jgi:alcohol dehydrogenase class IV|nr:MAG: NAD-dependent alcohol dehydrogenase [Deltaproteobacteria bacterium HGW-Deltaproteobacteria-13]
MAYDRDLSFIYNNPTRIVFGENSISEVGEEIERLKCGKAFLVTDKGVVNAGLAARVEKALGKKLVGTYDQCVQDSDLRIINEVAGIAREKGADIFVSLGGGSVIDTTKGAAIVLKEGGQIQDVAGYQMLSQPQTPHIVIPTTAGTGSEVTNAAVVKNQEEHRKHEIVDDNIYPNVGIIDPTMTAGLPPMLTATTGMDALCHAVEAIHCTQRQPMADAFALRAIQLIMEYLPQCVENGKDLFARGQQALAATMAGIAFTNSQTAMVHAIAHMLGGMYKVPHGLANSILLPHVVRFNACDCGDSYAMVAVAMGMKVSDEEAGEAVAGAITALSQKMGVPQRLRDAGVPEDGLAEASEVAMGQAPMVVNPRQVDDAQEVLSVLKQAW